MKILRGSKDITEYVVSTSWGGSKGEVARKLEIAVANAPYDPNIKGITIKLADTLYLYDDEDNELFRGYVMERERNSSTGTVTYVAYDMLIYTLKSSATYNFKSKTAETITKVVCDDVEVPVGSLASTGISQKLIVSNVSIYEIIMRAYTKAHQQNGKKYMVTSTKGKLNVIEMGNVVCDLVFSEDTNITASSYKESITNMVNKVRIYDSEGNQIGVVQDSSNVKKYGIFQTTYTKEEGKDATTTAKSMFVGVEKSVTLECVGYAKAVTGVGIKIKDETTGLSGLCWVDADTHKWENGTHLMSLTLTFKNLMDEKEE
jgi:hypothetical protein